jgi:hypothetical protein
MRTFTNKYTLESVDTGWFERGCFVVGRSVATVLIARCFGSVDFPNIRN